ncbi:MAG: hypothetical protein M0Z98_07840 [Actinomycetales bacterium]|nr:hypothetical protein [Actinomycetales bacterium]
MPALWSLLRGAVETSSDDHLGHLDGVVATRPTKSRATVVRAT